MEELEKIEAEEAVKADVLGFEISLIYLSSNISELLAFIID